MREGKKMYLLEEFHCWFEAQKNIIKISLLLFSAHSGCFTLGFQGETNNKDLLCDSHYLCFLLEARGNIERADLFARLLQISSQQPFLFQLTPLVNRPKLPANILQGSVRSCHPDIRASSKGETYYSILPLVFLPS